MLQHRAAFTRTRRNPWVWRGVVQPRPDGQVFIIDMEAGHRSGGIIKIWVREPTLVPTKETGRPPHTYADESLCVHDEVVSAYESIAATTVPWIYSWFYFYERWLETGTWDGPQSPGHEVGASTPAEVAKQEPTATKVPGSTSAPTRGMAA